MNTKQQRKDNELIAKFMGLIIITDGISYFDTDYKPLKNYHSDWNWLMEVVEKINLLEDFKYSVTIQTMDCYISDDKGKKIVSIDCIYNVDELKKSVYNACLEFIKWYNENSAKEN